MGEGDAVKTEGHLVAVMDFGLKPKWGLGAKVVSKDVGIRVVCGHQLHCTGQATELLYGVRDPNTPHSSASTAWLVEGQLQGLDEYKKALAAEK